MASLLSTQVLALEDFKTLPQHVVRLILSREDLQVDFVVCALRFYRLAPSPHVSASCSILGLGIHQIQSGNAMGTASYYHSSRRDVRRCGRTSTRLVTKFKLFLNPGPPPSSPNRYPHSASSPLDYVLFHKMSAAELMRDVKPTAVVPQDRLLTALAYQVS